MTNPRKPPAAPANLRSLQDRLRNLAAKAALPEGRVQRQLGTYVAAEILQQVQAGGEPGTSLFLVKGGSQIEMRLGISRSRASKDLDASFRGDFDQMYGRAREAFGIGWNGFAAELTPAETIAVPGLLVAPVRFKAKLKYRGFPFCTVPLEVSPAEASSGEEHDEIAPALLAHIGLEGLGLQANSKVACLALRYQIAQKLHACTEVLEGKDNDRAHDLVDIQLLMDLVDPTAMQPLLAACQEIFLARAMQAWPPTLQPPGSWAKLYPAARADVLEADALGLAGTIEEAVAVVQGFIATITEAEAESV